MKLLSWNVNGIRAASRSGFLTWFEREGADVVCLQEIKATPEQLDDTLLHPQGYHSYWNPAQKPGYSGVALYSKTEPLSIIHGLGDPEVDAEGRVLIAEYPQFTLINAYFPNSQREHTRLPFKLRFCDRMLSLCEDLVRKDRRVVLTGDFNIAHREIDLKNPKTNQDNAGFLPQERAWLDQFTGAGYVDTFRHFVPDPGHYTWWSYRPGVRQKNIGWRLDYFFTDSSLRDRTD
jgi:exodeoxyribonuclease-3